jgi:hypothetical protein
VESKLAGVDECERRSGLGCLHLLVAYGDTPLMHDDRCIAVRWDSVLLWDDEVLFFIPVPHSRSSEYFSWLFSSCVLKKKGEDEHNVKP